MPETAAFGDVATLGRVDPVKMPDSFTVLRVLPVSDEYLIFPDHWGRDHFIASVWPHRILGIQVELPQLLTAERLVTPHPAVSFAHHHLYNVPDLADRRRRPLPVQDPIADVVHFPDQLAGVFVYRDHGRCPRRRNVHVALVLPVGSADEDQIAVRNRR